MTPTAPDIESPRGIPGREGTTRRRRSVLRWRMAARALAAGVLAGLLLSNAPARAVIEKLTRLDELIKDCGWIAVAKIEKLSEDRPAAVVTITKTLKGTAEFEAARWD